MSEEIARPAPLVVALGADLIFASRLASVVGRVGGQFAQARDAAQLRRVLADWLANDPHPNPLPEGEGAGKRPEGEGAGKRPEGEAVAKRAEAPSNQLPALVLIDLGARGLDLAEAVRSAREAGARAVVAYGPNRDVAARRRALDAGCDRWLANSKLFEALPDLLRRRSGT